MTELVKPKTITLTRAEGPINLCDKRHVVHSWPEANALLFSWSRTAPAHGGYNKCDFTIIFEDGETYEGRYDLVHFLVEHPDLARHVRSHISYYAGKPPAWMITERPEVLDRYHKNIAAHPDRTAEAKHWLETYDLQQ